MFSSEFERGHHRAGSRVVTIALASSVLIAVVASLVSARTTPGGWALICGAVFIAAWPRMIWPPDIQMRSGLALALVAFFSFGAASALWAENPLAPMRAGLFGLALVVITKAVIAQVGGLSRPMIVHMGEGLWLGLLIALSYFFVELLSGQAVKLTLYNALGLGDGDLKPAAYFAWNEDGSLKSISINDMTRNTTPITLIMWSAMLAARGVLARPYGMSVAGLVFGLSVICVVLSPHETSKIALGLGAVVFALSYLSLRWVAVAMMSLWVGACVLMLPAVQVAYNLQLHEQETVLPNSVRARFIIWNETASQTMKSPVVGVGARMTYELGPRLLAQQPTRDDTWFPAKLSRHAHNAFLQTWFELGGVGVMLLLACGVFVVRAITRLPKFCQPFGMATFACAATVAASSYGMWQAWFMGLYAMVPVLFVLALTANTGAQRES